MLGSAALPIPMLWRAMEPLPELPPVPPNPYGYTITVARVDLEYKPSMVDLDGLIRKINEEIARDIDRDIDILAALTEAAHDQA